MECTLYNPAHSSYEVFVACAAGSRRAALRALSLIAHWEALAVVSHPSFLRHSAVGTCLRLGLGLRPLLLIRLLLCHYLTSSLFPRASSHVTALWDATDCLVLWRTDFCKQTPYHPRYSRYVPHEWCIPSFLTHHHLGNVSTASALSFT